jgi:hypothetical protein
VQLQVPGNPADRFQNSRGWPVSGWLRIGHFQQARRGKRADHLPAFRQRCRKAAAKLFRSPGWRQRELRISLPHVGLPIDAVQKPLAQVALEMKQQVGNGVFVVRSTVPHLFLRQLVEAAIDVLLRVLHLLHARSQKHITQLISHRRAFPSGCAE